MGILVAVTDYPDGNCNGAMAFVHTRNVQYVKNGIDVTVLNFACKEGYILDNIPVISLHEYRNQQCKTYDALVVHAPNIRNHYLFIRKNEHYFAKIMFVFHGHDVLNINKEYPAMYVYSSLGSKLGRLLHWVYDPVKLFLWRKYLPSLANKAELVFVSKFLFGKFMHYIGTEEYFLGKNIWIIPNGIGEAFENFRYSYETKKEYDFITIRSRIDASECCIDLVCQLAERYPQYRFLLIGKGEYFRHNRKPENIDFVDRFLVHEEILGFINHSRCALMLTRHDTQGVMSCELASTGMPLITSDIEICREVFQGFENVGFFSNSLSESLSEVFENIVKGACGPNPKFFYKNTILREEEILHGFFD